MEDLHSDYSIAQAKDQLPRLVHEVEEGKAVRLTRRGKGVAVLLSLGEYEALKASQQRPRRGVWDAIQEWRAKYPEGVDLTDEEIDSWRDRSLAREPDWLE